ncbi:hypothetical protein Sango_2883200 [Sesamum angolense]|uniref:Uncharacterized protein n=1 Tax=Sesamum angolense TaxID=2727404 RepID=A0AAE1W0B2_9LAMI|nr:hypothetical protein Sango_2883200 [Sesamum angolense]
MYTICVAWGPYNVYKMQQILSLLLLRLLSVFFIMDKSKSFPYYSSSYAEARFDFEDRAKSYSFNGPGDDPEVKRRKRVAGYNMYAVEGKLKSSFRNSLKWIKSKFTDNYYDS